LLTGEKGQANLLTPILYIITAITILWLMNYDRLKSIYSSGLLFMFWLLVSLASIPDIVDYSFTFHQQVSRTKSASLWTKFIGVWLHFSFALGLFITNFFAEKYIVPEMMHDERV
jgi:hypothetical protein